MNEDEMSTARADVVTPWSYVEIAPDDPEWGACEIWSGDDVIATRVCGVPHANRIVNAVNNHEKLVEALKAARTHIAFNTPLATVISKIDAALASLHREGASP